MGRRRNNNFQSRNRAMLAAFLPPVLVFLLIVAGIYIYNEKFGSDSASDYDNAIANCVADRTRVATTSDAQERATSDCVRDTPVGR